MCTQNVIAIVYIIFELQIKYNMQSGGDCVEPFEINREEEKISSISRTIRMKAETFDRINELNRKTGVSFNKIVNQCIEYALDNMKDE